MAAFSQNQVRQLYVAKVLKTGSNVVSTAGDIKVKSQGGNIYFEYMGAGGQVRSDLIKISNILGAKQTAASAMTKSMKRYKVSLNNAALVDGNPIPGQDYILRIAFRGYIGMSDQDQSFKYGMVHAAMGMTAESFYGVLYNSLIKNFTKNDSELLNFSMDQAKASLTLMTDWVFTAKNYGAAGNNIKIVTVADTTAAAIATSVSNGVTTITLTPKTGEVSKAKLTALIATDATAASLIELSGTCTTGNWEAVSTANQLSGGKIDGVIIEEKEQPWKLGVMSSAPVDFTLQPDYVKTSTDEVLWGTVTPLASVTSIGNGKVIADLEYFCMGNRGDIYRNISWPHVVSTEYLANSTNTYNVIDMHFCYVGSNESPQRSERDITIVIPVGGTGAENTLSDSIATAINTVTGASSGDDAYVNTLE